MLSTRTTLALKIKKKLTSTRSAMRRYGISHIILAPPAARKSGSEEICFPELIYRFPTNGCRSWGNRFWFFREWLPFAGKQLFCEWPPFASASMIHIAFLQLVAVCREIVFPRMAVRLRGDSYSANGEIVFPQVAATRGETVALRMVAVRINIHLFDMISSTA